MNIPRPRVVDDAELWHKATTPTKHGTTVLQYFESKLTLDWEFNCWIWTGRKTQLGYGNIYLAGQQWKTHRLSYELHRGSAQGMELDHLCRRPSCANPWHLEPVSPQVNVERALGYGTKPASGLIRRTAQRKTCEHGYSPPSRCPACRKARKTRNKDRAQRGAVTRRRNAELAAASTKQGLVSAGGVQSAEPGAERNDS